MCNLTFLFESVHIGKLKCNTAYSLLFTNIINQRAGKARVNAQAIEVISVLHNVIAWCKMYIWCAILQKKARENRHALTVLTVLETLLAVGKLFLITNCTKVLVQFL